MQQYLSSISASIQHGASPVSVLVICMLVQWAELKAELLHLPVSELWLTQVKHAELGIAQLNNLMGSEDGDWELNRQVLPPCSSKQSLEWY